MGSKHDIADVLVIGVGVSKTGGTDFSAGDISYAEQQRRAHEIYDTEIRPK